MTRDDFRRWTDKIRSLSIRRKFQFVFDGRDAEESSYRYYSNAPCTSLSLSLSQRGCERGGGEKEVFEESLPSKLSHLSEFLGKSIQSPRGENAAKRRKERERERRRGRRRLKRQKEQGHERAAFRFPHHFAPFTEGRAPRKGWLTALIVPVVTVYSDFHPVFFTRSLPLFFQLNPPAHSPLRHPAVQIIVTVRRPWPNSSRNERISLADLVIPRQPETSSFLLLLWNRHPLSLRNESNRFSTLCSLFATSLRPLVVPLNRGNHLLPLDLSYSIMWHQFLSITLFSVSFFIYLFLISLVSAK